jgi:hypothetical protein
MRNVISESLAPLALKEHLIRFWQLLFESRCLFGSDYSISGMLLFLTVQFLTISLWLGNQVTDNNLQRLKNQGVFASMDKSWSSLKLRSNVIWCLLCDSERLNATLFLVLFFQVSLNRRQCLPSTDFNRRTFSCYDVDVYLPFDSCFAFNVTVLLCEPFLFFFRFHDEFLVARVWFNCEYNKNKSSQ